MKLEDLQNMWEEDSKVDQTNLGRAAARVPELHAKYINILSTLKLQLRKADTDYIKLRRTKASYYRGELSKQELDDLGWEPYLLNRPLKNELDDIVNSDEDIIRILDKVEYLKTLVYHLEQIIRSINSRTWDIKSAIEWYKFTNGGL